MADARAVTVETVVQKGKVNRDIGFYKKERQAAGQPAWHKWKPALTVSFLDPQVSTPPPSSSPVAASIKMNVGQFVSPPPLFAISMNSSALAALEEGKNNVSKAICHFPSLR